MIYLFQKSRRRPWTSIAQLLFFLSRSLDLLFLLQPYVASEGPFTDALPTKLPRPGHWLIPERIRLETIPLHLKAILPERSNVSLGLITGNVAALKYFYLGAKWFGGKVAKFWLWLNQQIFDNVSNLFFESLHPQSLANFVVDSVLWEKSIREFLFCSVITH